MHGRRGTTRNRSRPRAAGGRRWRNSGRERCAAGPPPRAHSSLACPSPSRLLARGAGCLLPRPAAHVGPDVHDATAYSPPCTQEHDWSGRSGSFKDCLYLDVYTPKNSSGFTGGGDPGSRAVLIFMHVGGGFMTGDAEGPSLSRVEGSQLFNGSYVAEG